MISFVYLGVYDIRFMIMIWDFCWSLLCLKDFWLYLGFYYIKKIIVIILTEFGKFFVNSGFYYNLFYIMRFLSYIKLMLFLLLS